MRLRCPSSRFDPAVSPPASSAIWYPTCATLTAFRDAPAPAGLTTQWEAAAGPRVVSGDRRTYVFTVRRGLRFSDGSPPTPASLALALVLGVEIAGERRAGLTQRYGVNKGQLIPAAAYRACPYADTDR